MLYGVRDPETVTVTLAYACPALHFGHPGVIILGTALPISTAPKPDLTWGRQGARWSHGLDLRTLLHVTLCRRYVGSCQIRNNHLSAGCRHPNPVQRRFQVVGPYPAPLRLSRGTCRSAYVPFMVAGVFNLLGESRFTHLLADS